MKGLIAGSAVVLSLLAQGCQTASVYSRADPDRKLVCDEMQSSLNSDIDVGGFLSILGFDFRRDVANDITEQRLEALKRMIAHCRQWSLGEISSDAFAERLSQSSSVYVADLPANAAAADRRLALLETGLGSLDDRIRKEILAAISVRAQTLGSDGTSEGLLTAMTAEISRADLATRSTVEELAAQSQSRHNETAGTLSQLQTRIETLEQHRNSAEEGDTNDPASLSDHPTTEPSPPGGYLSVFFEVADDRLTGAAIADIDRLINRTNLRSGNVVVQGFADASGPRALNLALSERRASAVANYLRDKGVHVTGASGFGETRDFSTEAHGNRRVTIEVLENALF
ncbi:OmpA family protein [Brevundimonas subvibrioides]|uniref:OmpA family protein n=1 Tax=Brevundimonas subvibrioides TaxID=74313 RepID=UPI0022B55C01|nr:OmpA family protein [Brevundimonas subvibrioides]